MLYVVTPKISYFYTIAEVIDDSNKQPEKTIFCFVDKDGNQEFDKGQLKSLTAVGRMVEDNNAIWCKDLKEVVKYLNENI